MRGVVIVQCAPPGPVEDSLRDACALWVELMTIDWGQALKAIDKAICYLARYGHTGMDVIEQWTIRKIHRRMRLIGEIVTAENKAGTPSND